MKKKAFRLIVWLMVSVLSLCTTYIYFIAALYKLIPDGWYFLIISGILGTVFSCIKTSDAWDDLWDSN